MAIIRWFFGFCITVAVAAVAVMNVETAPFTYSPIHDTITLPLYVIALVPMALGFIFGGVVVWLNMGELRRDRRKQKREIKILEKEVDRLKKERDISALALPHDDLEHSL